MTPSDRLVDIHTMLFEMARGRFNVQIPITHQDDELDTLAVLLNMVAEEMRESVFHTGFIHPKQGTHHFSLLTLVLTPSMVISSHNDLCLELLGYDATTLVGSSLASYLVDDALLQHTFSVAVEGCPVEKDIHLPLTFIHRDGLQVPLQCHFSYLKASGHYVLNSIITRTYASDMVHDVSVATTENEQLYRHRRSDTLLIQQLYDYILNHLYEPLPSLKNLARQFGTNEFKIKDGFRHFFGTSIYQFYNEQRLRRAKLMIQQSELPMKQIAFENGFSNYPNFSKAFKKFFGHSPNETPRNNRHS